MNADDVDHVRIGAVNAIRQRVNKLAEVLNPRFTALWRPGTSLPVISHRSDRYGRAITVGTVGVNPGRTDFELDDAIVIPWAVELFGEGVVALALTEQGRKSVIERARRAMEAGEPLPPGVTPLFGSPFPVFRKAKGVDPVAEFAAMHRDGAVDLSDLLAELPAAPGAVVDAELPSGSGESAA